MALNPVKPKPDDHPGPENPESVRISRIMLADGEVDGVQDEVGVRCNPCWAAKWALTSF